jgi:septal ring factor EnvC (AmiA/AmiB activator)
MIKAIHYSNVFLIFEVLFRTTFLLCLLAESIKDHNQHTVNKQYERERQRLATGIEELRSKLMQIEAENSDLKVNMAHRTSQFQLIQEELLEKASNSSKLESEVSLELAGSVY